MMIPPSSLASKCDGGIETYSREFANAVSDVEKSLGNVDSSSLSEQHQVYLLATSALGSAVFLPKRSTFTPSSLNLPLHKRYRQTLRHRTCLEEFFHSNIISHLQERHLAHRKTTAEMWRRIAEKPCNSTASRGNSPRFSRTAIYNDATKQSACFKVRRGRKV